MTKSLPLALLIAAGLLSSTVTASAYHTIYGLTTVNGTQYNLSPGTSSTLTNLSYANLSGAVLSHADLSYTTLYNANLTGGAYLDNADLSNAVLSYANLTGAHLSYADFSSTYLYYANLTGADLSSTVLTGASLDGVNLTGATVSYSNWTDFSTNSGASGLGSYSYNTSLIIYTPAVPEPSTYGLSLACLALALAACRRRLRKNAAA